MSFWDLGGGKSATDDATGEYVAPSGGGLIPDDTNVLAIVEKAAWKANREGTTRRINLQWRVQAPKPYANRVLFQSLWVDDLPPGDNPEKNMAKQKDHKRKLANIDANAGGKLVAALAKVKANRPPTDDELLLITGKPMVIKVMVMKTTDQHGQPDKVQYISNIMPKTHAISDGKAGTVPDGKSTPGTTPGGSSRYGGAVMDDEIPF